MGLRTKAKWCGDREAAAHSLAQTAFAAHKKMTRRPTTTAELLEERRARRMVDDAVKELLRRYGLSF